MKTNMMKSLKPLAGMAVLIALAACQPGGKSESTAKAPEAGPSAALTAVFTKEKPAGAIAVADAVATAKPGAEIVVHGKLLGAEHIFVKNRAAFMIGDPAVLSSCDTKPGDNCPTPWDACCDSHEAKRAGTATVQVVDATGAVLRENVSGVGGLKELADVVIAGTVAPASGNGVLIINAKAIHTGK